MPWVDPAFRFTIEKDEQYNAIVVPTVDTVRHVVGEMGQDVDGLATAGADCAIRIWRVLLDDTSQLSPSPVSCDSSSSLAGGSSGGDAAPSRRALVYFHARAFEPHGGPAIVHGVKPGGPAPFSSRHPALQP